MVSDDDIYPPDSSPQPSGGALPPPGFSWQCPYCGTVRAVEDPASFDMCPACGYEVTPEILWAYRVVPRLKPNPRPVPPPPPPPPHPKPPRRRPDPSPFPPTPPSPPKKASGCVAKAWGCWLKLFWWWLAFQTFNALFCD